MARRRRERSPAGIKLEQPDRSGPTETTLLELANERGLFAQAKKREAEIGKKAALTPIPRPPKDEEGDDDDEAGLPPAAERVLETLLWSVSLAMLHFTLDVLVHHQYSVDRIVWPRVWMRFGQALLVFALLIYFLHPHAANPGLVPGLPPRYQSALRQAIFFTTSVFAGCYLIHITNSSGYMAVMKQAPPLGCLWVWSVIELDLLWAVLSLSGAGTFLWQKGYSIK
ncbi:hypothetical protein C8A01DRAFT_12620 [Parachaetomium inaequale]|uniref:DUF7719 domain-containing protein n=1 Tax=Parachaetomium inaequale TaxID=2588326 RepID=A0AAN6SVJ5_9PEZI|nr:hypothetical protein C8A01DRAFT_12620 [Parachaetomium inaequale]